MIREEAKEFAIMAHEGQKRKSEPDKDMIIHPIAVAKILEYYGYDENVISAGYLHDVVEDTKYRIEDINELFGSDIANLVDSASEPDKTLSWEKRKTHTINEIKNKPLRNKLIVCSDKINNIEDLIRLLRIKGMEVFKSFKRDYKSQLWYFENIYQSLIYNENKEEPIFIRLNETLSNLKKEIDYQIYLENNIFNDNSKLLNDLRNLQLKKYELLNLKQELKINKPYVIEFSGTPRTGKTTLINNINDFFEKGSFNTKIMEEFVSSEYYKNIIKPYNKNRTTFEINRLIMKEIIKLANKEIISNKDIVIVDRGIYDRCIWMQRAMNLDIVTKEEAQSFLDQYLLEAKNKVDSLFITYAEDQIALKRDYLHSLALESRNFLNLNNIRQFNKALIEMKDLFQTYNSNIHFIDTTNLTPNEVSILVTKHILNDMENNYNLRKEIKCQNI
ncbi:MAG: HD domain-containing protein [Bacilli bacterium]|nr:HD domain-containing protein [Bacilli bacterium]